MLYMKNRETSNKAVQSEPMSCGFHARYGQEFAAEWGDGVIEGGLSPPLSS